MRSNPTELSFSLSDGTVIKIYPPQPMTVEEGYLESCRWAERLEVFLHPDQQFAPAEFALGDRDPPK
jgi:hypothetical protein